MRMLMHPSSANPGDVLAVTSRRLALD